MRSGVYRTDFRKSPKTHDWATFLVYVDNSCSGWVHGPSSWEFKKSTYSVSFKDFAKVTKRDKGVDVYEHLFYSIPYEFIRGAKV